MKSIFGAFILCFLLLIATTSNARNDLSEYWRGVKDQQPMPEFLAKEFKQEPGLSVYDNELKKKEERKFTKEFEQEPGIFVYDNELKKKEERKFTKEFEQEPNLSAHDNENIKPVKGKSLAGDEEEKSSAENFEPKPIFWVYGDDQ